MQKTALLAAACAFALSACPKPADQPVVAPVGPAGAANATATAAPGSMPAATGAAPSSQPAAMATAPTGTAPTGAAPTGAAPTGAASMPAMPTVVKGNGAIPGGPAPTLDKGTRHEGTVTETMNAAGYTYLKVKTATGDIWAAIGETKVAVGEKVALTESLTMTDFHSKTLNRTFPSIIFASLAK